jgi:rhamnogalacturonyl hydrolase YesR
MNPPHLSARHPRAAFALSLAILAAPAPAVFADAAAPASGNTTASGNVSTAPASANTTAFFSHWPDGADPKAVGIRVAENVAVRKFRYETSPRNAYVIYPEAIAWYGALSFAHTIGNTSLQDTLIKKFDPFLTDAGAAHINRTEHVDFHVFGAVPFEIYLETKDKKYLPVGLSFADDQLNTVFLANGNYSKEARFWVDDLYMLPIDQLQAYRATGDKKYLDHTAKLFTDYLDKLQQPTGLFFHGTDAPYYWSRGNGWVAAGLTELLRDLPSTSPLYPHLMDGYKKMMAALLKYQGKDGLWHELVDHPEAWSETSGSAMFAFALVTGVKSGWLDAPTYGPAARAAWLGLVANLDKDANILNVCQGTNKWTSANGDPVQYYLTRKNDNAILTAADELHGQAPVLWTATALVR